MAEANYVYDVRIDVKINCEYLVYQGQFLVCKNPKDENASEYWNIARYGKCVYCNTADKRFDNKTGTLYISCDKKQEELN